MDNGGCSILGYAVFIDDGSNGDYIEANYINDAAVRLQPSLSTMEITTLALVNLGKTFRILVRAFNWAGSSDSPVLGVVFATLPLQPPILTVQRFNSTQITVQVTNYPESNHGGCDIVSYEIQMDDGQGGSFVSQVGFMTTNLD